MNILAIPQDSQVLLIDPVTAYTNQLQPELSKHIREQFRRLCKAAYQVQVPCCYALSTDAIHADNCLPTLSQDAEPQIFYFEHDRPICANTHLLETMKREYREQLFVCGFWLDDIVTATALEAATHGFNTHVITGLSLSHNEDDRQASLDRLNQYQIAPVSLRQLLYEWMVKTESEQARLVVKSCWEAQTSEEQLGTRPN